MNWARGLAVVAYDRCWPAIAHNCMPEPSRSALELGVTARQGGRSEDKRGGAGGARTHDRRI